MADISSSISITATKNSLTATGTGAMSVTMSGNDIYANVQTVGFAADEALELGADVSDPPAVLFLKNLDAANFVEVSIGADMTKKFIKLLAGESCVIRPSQKTLRVQADTGNVDLQVISAST